MNAANCPDAATLAALLENEAAEPVSEYAEHLETCACCQQTLAELADGLPWMEAAHYLWQAREGPGQTTVNEPALQRVMGQLKNDLPLLVESGEPAPEDEELPLPFLRPADRPGLLGHLGAFEVVEVIGRGGMGVVLKAVDPALNRVVALKVLSPHLTSSASARKRFTWEPQSAAAVCHDHIVTVPG